MLSPEVKVVRQHQGLFQRACEAAVYSLKVNLMPGLFLQILMAGMAVAYFFHPYTRNALEDLALLRSNWGIFFSFVGTSVSSAIFPEFLRSLLPKLEKHNKTLPGLGIRLLFGIPFWGLMGMQVDLFYRLQYFLFGPSTSATIIAKKVLIDAFLYCPVLAVPQTVCVFLWRDHGFTFKPFHGLQPLHFYALNIFPVLMANWMVWIPIICIIYALPPALGVPFFIIAQSFWVMVLTTLTARNTNRH